jgi:multidrug efflux pump subunit AcrA (membrane-fusion protein)
VTVEAIIPGSIRNVSVEEGDHVREGQTLFTFEYKERNLVHQKRVTAPVTGTVTKSIVLHPDQAVGEMSGLVSIVPEGYVMVVEAVVPERDAGQLHEDMPVRLHFTAFPQQKYGSVAGKILSISPDVGATINSKRNRGETLSGFRITTSIERTEFPDIHDRNKTCRIKLGMTAEVRIITEKGTVLSLFIKQLKKEASLRQQ